MAKTKIEITSMQNCEKFKEILEKIFKTQDFKVNVVARPNFTGNFTEILLSSGSILISISTNFIQVDTDNKEDIRLIKSITSKQKENVVELCLAGKRMW
jgi:hypothetical protein